MVFVFIALILSLALIPLAIIDLKIKVSETQFELAIRSLKETQQDKAQKRMHTKQRLSQIRVLNWSIIQTKLTGKYLTKVKKLPIGGYLLVIENSKSLKRKIMESWDKMHHLRKSKNSRTNHSMNDSTTRSAKR